MSQHDYILDNSTGASFRADLNAALLAVVTDNSGATEPSVTYAYQRWVDTSTGAILKIRDSANTSWVTIGDITVSNAGFLTLSGGTMTGALVLAALGNITTLDLNFTGDANTGFYRAGADLLGLVAGGVELLRIDGILGYVKMLGTKALLLPAGTSAQRPTGVAGQIRYNSDTSQFEGYSAAWGALGSSGSSCGAAGLEVLEQKIENEHAGISTAPLKNSLGTGFSKKQYNPQIILMTPYTSGGATMDIAIDPVYLNDSDKDTDSTTGWTANAAGTSLTTGTAVIGAASLHFNKNSSATNARITYDRGSANFNINDNTDLCFAIVLPSVTGLTNVEVRVDIDGTNYQTYTATTDNLGNALIVGTNIMVFDLSTGGTASGTGWDRTKAARYIHIGVNTGSAGQTYSGILVDSILFSRRNGSSFIQKGSELTIYDATNQDSLIIDSSSNSVRGTIVLGASVATSYAGGQGTLINRNVLQVDGSNSAKVQQGLTGEVADLQSVRQNLVLPSSLASADFDLTSGYMTNMIFEVVGVGSSTAITVNDAIDMTANLVSGVVLRVFKTTHNAQGKNDYQYRSLDLTITSSSASAGITTINTSTNTGIAIGDRVVMKVVDPKISLVAETANENFVSPTETEVYLNDVGLPYPNDQYVWGHWKLGGNPQIDAVRNRKGVAPSLTVNGSPTLQNDFLNGALSLSNMVSQSNFLSIANASSTVLKPQGNGGLRIQMSFWVYAPAFTGTHRVLMSQDSPSAGWDIALDDSTNQIDLYFNGMANLQRQVPINPNSWNHIFVYIHDSDKNYICANGVYSASAIVNSASNTAGDFDIGGWYAASLFAGTTARIADLIIWSGGPELSTGQVEEIRNFGRAVIVGEAPQVKTVSQATGLTGQKLSLKATVSRTTDVAYHSVTKVGAIKSN